MDTLNQPAGNNPKSKFWTLVAVALIIIGGLWWVYKKGPSLSSTPTSTNQTSNQTANTPQPVPQIPTKEIAKDQLPDSWPSDIPMEAGAKVTVNYQRTTPEGNVQLVRAFNSAKTVDANAKIYTDYFTSAGFTVGGKIDQATFKSYLATKGNEMLQVLIQQDAKTKVVNVNITVTFGTKPF